MTTKLILLGLVAAVAGILALAGVVPLELALALGASIPVVGMILDERSEFADATTIPTPTGLALLGDVMDLTKFRNIGNNQSLPIYLVIQIDTAVTSAGAATVQFSLVSDAQAAIAVDGTATVHATSAAVAKATLIAGFTIVLPVPPQAGVAYERFLGVLSNPAVAALTAGKANAFLTTNPKQWIALDNGI